MDTGEVIKLSSVLEDKIFAQFKGKQLPYQWFELPPGFSFKPIFPSVGAAVRFRICKSDNRELEISVYLDTGDVLGCVGQPYWEAYPLLKSYDEDLSPKRYLVDQTEKMIADIVNYLNNPKEEIWEQ